MINAQNLLFSEGLYVLLFLVLLIAIGICWWRPIAYLGVLVLCFSYYFFRNPNPPCPTESCVLVSPADGTIIAITTDPHDTQGYATRLSIFLSIWDVHVQWAPLAGSIERIAYRSGTFSLAYLPKSSLYNERNDIVIRCADHSKVLVRQIAGTVARRISCWVHEGQPVTQCEKIGMIRFGSRVDLFLPAHITVTARVGDCVKGGTTIIGHLMPIDWQT